MRVSRTMLGAVAAWLAVVLVGSTMVWAVISQVGEQVVGAEPSPQAATATSPAGRIGRPSHTSAGTPDSSGGPGPASPTATPGASSPSAQGSAPAGPGATTSPGAPEPSSEPSSPPPPPPPAAVQGSWSGVGGTVIVQCRASAVSLVAATPDAGFSVEVEKEESALEVKFDGQGEDGRETHVQARCLGGRPRFGVETDGGESGD